MDDLTDLNPFETKTNINNSIELLNDINPFETKTKINNSIDVENEVDPFKSTANLNNSIPTTLDNRTLQKNSTPGGKEGEPNFFSLDGDIRDTMLSPEDLPNLELITSHSPRIENIVNQEIKQFSPQTDAVGVPDSNIKQSDPNFMHLTKQSTSKRKISTPEFEEAERQFMMEEIKTDITDTSNKSQSFNLDCNATNSKLQEELEQDLQNEANLLAQRVHQQEELDNQEYQMPPFVSKDKLGVINSETNKPSSVFSPIPSTLHHHNIDTNTKERHTHWDEYMTKEDEGWKNECSKNSSEVVKMELHYQATLLDKDKLLHDKEKEIQKLDHEISKVKQDMQKSELNNKGMLEVVKEYEKTISEVINDRERDRVCNDIAKENLKRERDQTLEDLHSAERAFNDVHRYVTCI